MEIIIVVSFSYLCGSIPFGLILTKYFSGKDIRKSINIRANLVFISPVFETTSHKNKKGLGIIKLGLLVKLFKIPVIALGGINNNNVSRLRSLPISGCAGIDIFSED